jgi:hypothetical protein
MAVLVDWADMLSRKARKEDRKTRLNLGIGVFYRNFLLWQRNDLSFSQECVR